MQYAHQLRILSWITAREILRNPVCVLIAVSTVLITIMIPMAVAYQFGDTAKRLAGDSGLAFQLVAGILISAYAACSIVHRDRHTGSASMILSKPVIPAVFFLSRFIGIAAVLLVFSITTGLSTLLAQRMAEIFSTELGFATDHTTALFALLAVVAACVTAGLMNYSRNASFCANVFIAIPILLASVAWLSGYYDQGGNWSSVYKCTLSFKIITPILFVFLALLMFTAVALTLALVFTSVTTTVFCFLMLFAGLSAEWLINGKYASAPTRWILLALLPDWQHFWLADFQAHRNIPTGTLLQTGAYALFYTAATLSLGALIFHRSEKA